MSTEQSLKEIDSLAADLCAVRAKLAAALERMADDVRALERQRAYSIKRIFESAVSRQRMLSDMIEDNRGLFAKPKSRIVQDLKFGLRKGKGGIDFEDEDQVIALIERKLPEKSDILIKTTKKVLKSGLNQLDVKDLKAIGCTVEESGDVIFVQSIDSALKKQIDRMLSDITETPATEPAVRAA